MRARIWTTSLLVLAAAPAGLSQDAVPEPASGMSISVAGAVGELMDGYKAAMADFRAAYGDAETDEARKQAMDELYPNAADWFADLWEIVGSAPADPACVEALLWIAQNDHTGVHAQRAGGVLLAEHLESEELGAACWTFARSSKGAGFLTQVMEQSPHADVRAVAQYNLAKNLIENDPEAAARAEELLSAVEIEHADVGHPYKGTLGVAARADLFELRNLALGMVVPEIEGVDLDGVAFKLSDYRGKVVLLDFWGNW